jgi:viologen exporter family transport system permease protein
MPFEERERPAPSRVTVRPVRRTLRAIPTLLRVGFAEAVAYRAEMLVWLLSTTMPLVMLALMSAVAREAPVGRFGQAEFAAYYLAALVVRLNAGAWVIWEVNFEIRQGTLAFRLLRPIHPLVSYACANVGAMPLRLLASVPVIILALATLGVGRFTHDPLLLALFPLTVVGAWLITFLAMAVIGALAFAIDSSSSVFELWLGLYGVFSGYLIPLELFPRWLEVTAKLLPFRFMLSFPVEMIIGLTPRPAALRELALQWTYVAVLALAARITWRAGLRRFAAFGG